MPPTPSPALARVLGASASSSEAESPPPPPHENLAPVSTSAASIVWYRGHDLRTHDQPALTAAIAAGAPVVAAFVLDIAAVWRPKCARRRPDAAGDDRGAGGGCGNAGQDVAEENIGGIVREGQTGYPKCDGLPLKMGRVQRWYLHHSLLALEESLAKLRIPLVFVQGDPAEELPRLAETLNAKTVFWTRRQKPRQRRVEDTVEQALGRPNSNAEPRPLLGDLLVHPGGVTQRFDDFHSFFGFWLDQMRTKPPPRPKRALTPADIPQSPLSGVGMDGAGSRHVGSTNDWRARWPALPLTDVNDLGLLLDIRGAPVEAPPLNSKNVGCQAAMVALEAFVHGPRFHRFADPEARRDGALLRDLQATSHMSPHVRFGELSPRTLFYAVVDAGGRVDVHEEVEDEERRHQVALGASRAFLKNICLREFGYYMHNRHPDASWKPIVPEYQVFPWAEDRDGSLIEAWRTGTTGYPIVDAAMRQLAQEGWIHNRMRYVVAAFFCKYLLLPWNVGAAYLVFALVDGDEACNSLGWQWIAGCNSDSIPSTHIINPAALHHNGVQVSTDAAAYVRKYVPELAGLPDKLLFAPWAASTAAQASANVVVGTGSPLPASSSPSGPARVYPARIVCPRLARTRAREAITVMRRIFHAQTIQRVIIEDDYAPPGQRQLTSCCSYGTDEELVTLDATVPAGVSGDSGDSGDSDESSGKAHEDIVDALSLLSGAPSSMLAPADVHPRTKKRPRSGSVPQQRTGERLSTVEKKRLLSDAPFGGLKARGGALSTLTESAVTMARESSGQEEVEREKMEPEKREQRAGAAIQPDPSFSPPRMHIKPPGRPASPETLRLEARERSGTNKRPRGVPAAEHANHASMTLRRPPPAPRTPQLHSRVSVDSLLSPAIVDDKDDPASGLHGQGAPRRASPAASPSTAGSATAAATMRAALKSSAHTTPTTSASVTPPVSEPVVAVATGASTVAAVTAPTSDAPSVESQVPALAAAGPATQPRHQLPPQPEQPQQPQPPQQPQRPQQPQQPQQQQQQQPKHNGQGLEAPQVAMHNQALNLRPPSTAFQSQSIPVSVGFPGSHPGHIAQLAMYHHPQMGPAHAAPQNAPQAQGHPTFVTAMPWSGAPAGFFAPHYPPHMAPFPGAHPAQQALPSVIKVARSQTEVGLAAHHQSEQAQQGEQQQQELQSRVRSQLHPHTQPPPQSPVLSAPNPYAGTQLHLSSFNVGAPPYGVLSQVLPGSPGYMAQMQGFQRYGSLPSIAHPAAVGHAGQMSVHGFPVVNGVSGAGGVAAGGAVGVGPPGHSGGAGHAGASAGVAATVNGAPRTGPAGVVPSRSGVNGAAATRGWTGPVTRFEREEISRRMAAMDYEDTVHGGKHREQWQAIAQHLLKDYCFTDDTDRQTSRDYVRLCVLKDELRANSNVRITVNHVKELFRILNLQVTGEWDRRGHGGVRGPYVYGIRPVAERVVS